MVLNPAPLQVSHRPSGHIEGEPARLVPADFRLRKLGKEVADFVEHTGIGGWVGAWRPTNGTLVNGNDLVEVLKSVELGKRKGALGLLVKMVVKGGVEGLGSPKCFCHFHLTPVMQMKVPKGSLRSTPLRL